MTALVLLLGALVVILLIVNVWQWTQRTNAPSAADPAAPHDRQSAASADVQHHDSPPASEQAPESTTPTETASGDDQTADDRLLRRVSHDLRATVGTIVGALDLIELKRGSPEAVQRWAPMINSASMRLVMMVDNLVWAADTHRGLRQVGPVELVDIGAVVQNAVETIQQTAAGRAATITLEPITDTQRAWTHQIAIEQCIINVLDNACTSGSHPSVSIAVTGDDSHVSVVVTDTGTGIGPEDFERLQRRAIRGPNAAGAGLGLGLTAVTALMDNLGGTVECERGDPVGTVVTLSIPVVPVRLSGSIVAVDVPRNVGDLLINSAAAHDCPVVTAQADDARGLLRSGVPAAVVASTNDANHLRNCTTATKVISTDDYSDPTALVQAAVAARARTTT